MKAALQLLFVFFYLSSTYAVTQERTELITGKIQSHPENHNQLEDSSNVPGHGFPHFPQAKPARPHLELDPTQAVSPQLETSHWTLSIQKISLKAILSVDGVLSRAPPFSFQSIPNDQRFDTILS